MHRSLNTLFLIIEYFSSRKARFKRSGPCTFQKSILGQNQGITAETRVSVKIFVKLTGEGRRITAETSVFVKIFPFSAARIPAS